MSSRDRRFVIDGAYLRGQATEAVRTFVAPLKEVYRAASGDRLDSRHRDVDGEIKSGKRRRSDVSVEKTKNVGVGKDVYR